MDDLNTPGTREDREPDYKAAMLYHSDRADAYMVERDKLATALAAKDAEIERLTQEGEDRHQLHLEQVKITNEWIARAEAAEATAARAREDAIQEALDDAAIKVSADLVVNGV